MKNSIKKVIAGLSVAAMFASVMPIVSAWYDDDVNTDDFKVRDVNGGVTIEEYVGPSSNEIIIPEEIGDKKVVSIDTLAFASVSNDVKIYVPENVNLNKSGWEPFLTAGAVNKGVIAPVEDKTPRGVIKYWGKMLNVDPEKLKDEYIDKQVNKAIDQFVENAAELVPDIDVDDFTNFNDIMKELNINTDGIDMNIQFDMSSVNDVSKKVDELKNIEISVDFDKIMALPENERQDALNAEVRAQVAAKIEEIQKSIETVNAQIDKNIADLEAKKADIKNDVDKKVADAQAKALEKIDAKVVDIKNTLNDVMSGFTPEALTDKINNMIAETTIFNTLSAAPEKVLSMIDKVNVEDSLVSSALKVIKDYKEDPNEFVKKMSLSDANKGRLEKVMKKVDQVVDIMPYTGVTLVVSEDNAQAEEFEKHAGERGITFATGEPTEPTTQPIQTSISVSEVVVTVPGSDVTHIETVTVPVEVPGPVQTVTVPVPGPVQTVTVPVPGPVQTVTYIQTVIITEPTTATTKKPILLGDANLDGKIDLYDAITIGKHMAGTKKLEPGTEAFESADIDKKNGDGIINLYDAIRIGEIMAANRKK